MRASEIQERAVKDTRAVDGTRVVLKEDILNRRLGPSQEGTSTGIMPGRERRAGEGI